VEKTAYHEFSDRFPRDRWFEPSELEKQASAEQRRQFEEHHRQFWADRAQRRRDFEVATLQRELAKLRTQLSPAAPDDLITTAVAPGDTALATTRLTQPAHARAAASYGWVCSKRPDLIPKNGRRKYAREQWSYIQENDCPTYLDENGAEIPVPDFETWKRYVRAGLADPSNPKASSRAGREHGKSIVKATRI